jgi:ATP-dependent helicase/nuclease subunit A
MSTLHIYRSSAGSGKTHTLVSAYLQLALTNPVRFQEILAITFTNQATQEMKQRILTYLYSLTKDTATPIAANLLEKLGWEPSTLQQQAKKLLSHILHRYDRFTVTTIDSFFQTIIRSFAQELGIPPKFNIELNQEVILKQLIDGLLTSVHQEPRLQEWLISFAEHKLMQGKSWHLKDELTYLGQELFKETFLVHETALTQATQDKNFLYDFLAKLQQTIAQFETTLQELGKTALHAMHKAQLSVSDFAYGTSGAAGYLWKLQQKQKNFAPTQRARHAMEHIAAWHSKASPQKQAIINLVTDSLQAILQQAIEFYQVNHQHYYTALEIQRFFYGLGIITHLQYRLQDYRDRNKVMLIADTTNLLRQVIAENDTPFIYEKIGTYYKHFLIDELQDISAFQWQNIQPLIDNGLAEGYTSFLVGDVKQSIYRWRGGNSRLLATQLNQVSARIATITLDQNWRSKQHIVGFNNTFFTQASLVITNHFQTEIQALNNPTLQSSLHEQVKEIAAAYQDVYQHMPEPHLQQEAGYVQVSLVKDEEETQTGTKLSWQEQVKQQLPILMQTLQDDGYQLGDIALLVRNHAEGKAIFQTLLAYQQSSHAKPGYQYKAISAESLCLGHNPWINILINALKYLADQEDILAKTELIYLYQCHVCKNNLADFQDAWQLACKPIHSTLQHALLPQRLWDERTKLQDLPLYERLVALIPIFQLQQAEVAPFIQAFLDAVLNYLKKEPAEVACFLDWWQNQGSATSLPQVKNHEAVSIMTIHQAKGLQFKVAIIPFCDWDFDHSPQRSPIIWCKSTVEPFSQFPSLPLQYNKNLQYTWYTQAYYEERIQTYLDNLNLAYVAFTRPEDRLYIFGKQAHKNSLKTISELLAHNFAQAPPLPNHDEVREKDYVIWHQYWDPTNQTLTLGTPTPVQKHTMQADHSYTAPFLANPWSTPIMTTLPLEVPNGPIPTTHIHTIKLAWIAEILTKLQAETQLQDLFTYLQIEKGLNENEMQELKHYLIRLWKNPLVKAWYDGSWVLYNTPLLTPSGHVHQPNRVMIQKQKALVAGFLMDDSLYDQASQQVTKTADLLNKMQYASVKTYLLNISTQALYDL